MNFIKRIAPLGFLAAGCAVLAGCAEQQALTEPAPQIETYDARAFFETTNYEMANSAGFAFSPDDSEILVSSDATGIYNVEALAAGGGAPTPLTHTDEDSTFAISWFPEDRRILYSHDNGGDELDHVYVQEEDGAVHDLTPGEDVKAGFLGWTSDGASFFLTTNERDPKFFDVYRYDAASYERALAFQNDESWSPDAVSANGRYLALTRQRTFADSDLFIADLETDGAPAHITAHEGNIAYGVYGFTPDNTRLVYSTDEFGEFTQAWTYDLASGDKDKLVADDWDVMFVFYSPSGKYRVWAINEDARTTVRIFDEDAGAMLDAVEFPQGALANIRFSRDESKIAFLLSRDTAPNNAMIADLGSGEIKQLTDALNPAIDESQLVEASIERYPSFDKLQIPGVLYRPQGASADNRVPALVLVHGGPGSQSRAGYSATIQHLVNHGYAVFAANNRGSSGYGKTFFHMDDRKHGEVDLQDIVYAEHWLAEQDWVDADKIGIIGGSYGGYMVGAALAFEPDVFKVGIDIFGVMNWVRTLESIPPWWESFREALYDEMGDPATDGERHRRISPLFHAENIRVPLLVVQGENDPRVLKVESDEIVAAVRANGVPVEYVVFDDEGHGFTKRENRITASGAYIKFLDRYLKGEAPADAEE